MTAEDLPQDRQSEKSHQLAHPREQEPRCGEDRCEGKAVLQFCLELCCPHKGPRASRLYVNLRSKASFVAILDLN